MVFGGVSVTSEVFNTYFRSPLSSPSGHQGHRPGSVSGQNQNELERVTLWEKVKLILVSGRQYQKQLQEVYKNYNIPIELRQSFPEVIEETFMPWADGPPGEITPCQGYLVDNENVERLLLFMIRNVTEKLNALAASKWTKCNTVGGTVYTSFLVVSELALFRNSDMFRDFVYAVSLSS